VIVGLLIGVNLLGIGLTAMGGSSGLSQAGDVEQSVTFHPGGFQKCDSTIGG